MNPLLEKVNESTEILDHLNAGHCPDCGGNGFLTGPEAGIMQNIKCKHCGSEFNYCPPCEVLREGRAHRIGEPKVIPDFSLCQAQLMRVTLFDRELALSLKDLLACLDEADFESANKVIMHCQRQVWKNLCIARGVNS